MSNYNNLKSSINNNIYENQTQQITGTVLNAILNEMTNALGAGYQFAGVATVGMTPSEPDARIFYLAGEGIYTSFDGIQVPAGKLGILKWDNRWHLETIDGLGSGGANLTGYVTVASTDDLPDEGVATLGYLCGENLYLYVGEGGDTKEGKYQNCGSFRGPQGDSVQDVEQTQTSLENGGVNKIKFTLSNGISCEFQVRNGTTSSGLFPTLADLQAAYPSPVVGQYAFVGSGFPADIYICTTAGTWSDSGEDYDGDNVDLTDYATKAEVNELDLKVDEKADQADLSQLEAEVYDLLPDETGPTITPNYSEGERFKNGNIGTSTQFGHFEPILLPAHCTIVLNDGNNIYWSNIAVVYECDSTGNFIRPILTDGQYQSKPAIYTNDLDTDIYVGISCYKTTLKYCIKTPVEPVDYFEAKGDAIKNYILSESFTVVSATYDSEGIVSSASVKWPDGTTGTISVTRDSDGNTTQVVATQGQDTYTLSITRNATGQVTATSIVKS